MVGEENVMTNETEEFEDLWHDECEGMNGENLTAFINMIMEKLDVDAEGSYKGYP